ncbi:MAG: hypothetical protein IKP69_12150, partial [Oscillospiraceae bacterium]|nr:hypothetical protein [Oscillospiraceae bacterium]
NDVTGITCKIPFKNLADYFCFLRYNFKFSVNDLITIADAVSRLTVFITFADTPFAVFGDGTGFFLCETCKEGNLEKKAVFLQILLKNWEFQ